VRSLGPDEAELWARVTATIRPLSRRPVDSDPAVDPPAAAIASHAKANAAPAPTVRTVPRKAPTPPPPPRPGTTLDGSWDRKLKAGTVEPDRILDLHGMNLEGAWSAIDSALERAIAAGDRVLLLVTGHARPDAPPVQRGRIRAAIHDWLAVSRHASRIAAVRAAHGRHGGGGSLYIILRRR
jgi:DNA-nicking Smr family endonuclease